MSSWRSDWYIFIKAHTIPFVSWYVFLGGWGLWHFPTGSRWCCTGTRLQHPLSHTSCFTIHKCPLDLHGTGCSLWSGGGNRKCSSFLTFISHLASSGACIKHIINSKLCSCKTETVELTYSTYSKCCQGLISSDLAQRCFCGERKTD